MAEKLAMRRPKYNKRGYTKAFKEARIPKNRKKSEILDVSYSDDTQYNRFICGLYNDQSIGRDLMLVKRNNLIDGNSMPSLKKPSKPDKIKGCLHTSSWAIATRSDPKLVTESTWGTKRADAIFGPTSPSYFPPVHNSLSTYPIEYDIGRIGMTARNIQPSINDLFHNEFNVIAFLVELREALSLVKDGTKIINDFLASGNKGNLASSAILWHNFGASPTSSDLAAIYERLFYSFEFLQKWNMLAERRIPIIVHRTVGGSGFRTEVKGFPLGSTDTQGYVSASSIGPYSYDEKGHFDQSYAKGKFTQKITLKYYAKPCDGLTWMSKVLGVDDFKSVIAGLWEGIPFSWLVDYFIQIGDWLQSDLFLPYEFDSGCVSCKIIEDYGLHYSQGGFFCERVKSKVGFGSLAQYGDLQFYQRKLITKEFYSALVSDAQARRDAWQTGIKVNKFSFRHMINGLAVAYNPFMSERERRKKKKELAKKVSGKKLRKSNSKNRRKKQAYGGKRLQ